MNWLRIWPGEGCKKHRKLGVIFSKGSWARPEVYLCICLWWVAVTFSSRGIEIERLWK